MRGVNSLLVVLILGGVFCAAPAAGQAPIIVRKTSGRIAISVDGLRGSSSPEAQQFKRVLVADLDRFSWFEVNARGAVVFAADVDSSGGRLQVACRVMHRGSRRSYLNRTFAGAASQARQLAHEVHDALVKAVTGRRGIAATRIVMIGAAGNQSAKEVYLCDADGDGLQQLTRDKNVSLMPRWGPAGDRIVYTSYKSDFPDAYIVDLVSGRRERIAGFPGLNTGAEFFPDGDNMVLTLSKDGNPDLYALNLKSQRTTRLTRTRSAAETSPTVSPDGNQIAFVSDTSGRPQIYIMNRRGGERRRITLHGSENVAPDWGPDGRIVYSSRRFGRYQLFLYDPRTDKEQELTQEAVDHEDPSWAPDGRHVCYTREEAYRQQVYVLDTISRRSIRLTRYAGSWYAAAWSPW
tara:strand:- start:337 stop:1554 length:1218 start_codon:yes stop_codon:yes gene_type:complete